MNTAPRAISAPPGTQIVLYRRKCDWKATMVGGGVQASAEGDTAEMAMRAAADDWHRRKAASGHVVDGGGGCVAASEDGWTGD